MSVCHERPPAGRRSRKPRPQPHPAPQPPRAPARRCAPAAPPPHGSSSAAPRPQHLAARAPAEQQRAVRQHRLPMRARRTIIRRPRRAAAAEPSARAPARSTTMTEVRHDAAAHRFSTEVDGQRAVLDYTMAGDVMTITHTGVPAAIGGRGIAADLMRAALRHRRRRRMESRSRCALCGGLHAKHGDATPRTATRMRGATRMSYWTRRSRKPFRRAIRPRSGRVPSTG